MRVGTLFVGLLLVLACGPLARPALVEGDPHGCFAACAHLRALGCSSGQPTARGLSCEAWCEDIERSGYISMDPACVEEAPSCAAANECGGPP